MVDLRGGPTISGCFPCSAKERHGLIQSFPTINWSTPTWQFDLFARISDDQVVIPDGDNRVTITLIEEEVKHLGSLDLPMQQVAFEFAGYSEQEMEQFMKTFDERTLRAGGL